MKILTKIIMNIGLEKAQNLFFHVLDNSFFATFAFGSLECEKHIVHQEQILLTITEKESKISLQHINYSCYVKFTSIIKWVLHLIDFWVGAPHSVQTLQASNTTSLCIFLNTFPSPQRKLHTHKSLLCISSIASNSSSPLLPL